MNTFTDEEFDRLSKRVEKKLNDPNNIYTVEYLIDQEIQKLKYSKSIKHQERTYPSHRNDDNSDWVKSNPVSVDWVKLHKNRPGHRWCQYVIRRSEKNPMFIGLYCKDHNKLLQWVNEYQVKWLLDNETGIINESGTDGWEKE